MKKFLTTLVVLAAVSGAVNANVDKPKSPVGMAVMKTGSIVKVYYKGARAGDVKVTIYNDKNEKVYTETLRRIDSFMRPYNFSTLNEGSYTLVLENEDGRQLEKVNYSKGKVEKLMNLVHVTGEANKYLLTVANRGQETLQVKIYNEANTLLYAGTESIEGDFAKVYNLNEISGKFLFEVTDKSGNTQQLTYEK